MKKEILAANEPLGVRSSTWLVAGAILVASLLLVSGQEDPATANEGAKTAEPPSPAEAEVDAEEEEEEEEEPFEYSNWIELSVGGVFLDGKKPLFSSVICYPATPLSAAPTAFIGSNLLERMAFLRSTHGRSSRRRTMNSS